MPARGTQPPLAVVPGGDVRRGPASSGRALEAGTRPGPPPRPAAVPMAAKVKAPAWLMRPVSAAFGFGGKLVQVGGCGGRKGPCICTCGRRGLTAGGVERCGAAAARTRACAAPQLLAASLARLPAVHVHRCPTPSGSCPQGRSLPPAASPSARWASALCRRRRLLLALWG